MCAVSVRASPPLPPRPPNTDVFLKKFVSFYLHTIGSHNAFNQPQYRKEKLENRRLCEAALGKLEALTVRIREHYDALEASGEVSDGVESAEDECGCGSRDAEHERGDPAPARAPPAEEAAMAPGPPAAAGLARSKSSWDNLKLPHGNMGAVVRPRQPEAPAVGGNYPGLPKTQRREADASGESKQPPKRPSRLQGLLGCRTVIVSDSPWLQ